MAELAQGRIYKRKRIKDPNNASSFVEIPVIYEAHFKCMDQAQEFFLYFDNSFSADRKTHIRRVSNPSGSALGIDVERIDEFKTKVMAEQAQESVFVLVNKDPPPLTLNGAVADTSKMHELVHYVRYFKDNNQNSSVWVDCELIDQFVIKDAVSQAQEWIWFTKHPELGDSIANPGVSYAVTVGYCDPSLELAPDESDTEGLDPPYRLDPFQNIVAVNFETPESQPVIGLFYAIVATGLDEDHLIFADYGWTFDSEYDLSDPLAFGQFLARCQEFKDIGYVDRGGAWSFLPETTLFPSKDAATAAAASAAADTGAGHANSFTYRFSEAQNHTNWFYDIYGKVTHKLLINAGWPSTTA